MEYDNTNTGVLFKNNKEGNEKRPDYTGSMELEGGKKMKLAAWVRESQKGQKFLSVKMSEPMAQVAGLHTKAMSQDELDDELPF
jgi:uncharacterized protein (DUF736 family)